MRVTQGRFIAESKQAIHGGTTLHQQSNSPAHQDQHNSIGSAIRGRCPRIDSGLRRRRRSSTLCVRRRVTAIRGGRPCRGTGSRGCCRRRVRRCRGRRAADLCRLVAVGLANGRGRGTEIRKGAEPAVCGDSARGRCSRDGERGEAEILAVAELLVLCGWESYLSMRKQREEGKERTGQGRLGVVDRGLVWILNET